MPTHGYEPAFVQCSPMSETGVQLPPWTHQNAAPLYCEPENHVAQLNSNICFQTSMPLVPVPAGNGISSDQTAFLPAPSWNPSNWNVFQPASMLSWTEGGQIADSRFSNDVTQPSQFVVPTQLVTQAATMSPQTVHSEESDYSSEQVERDSIRTHHNNRAGVEVDNRAIPTSDERQAKDDTLIRLRNQGLSYKEIKRQTGFVEAESTLRGRIRVLSKPAHQRVRKPTWRRSDVSVSLNKVDRSSQC